MDVVNGTDPDVLEGEDNKEMFFSFLTSNATDILWDPKTGVITNDIVLPQGVTVTVIEPEVTVTELVTVTEQGTTVT